MEDNSKWRLMGNESAIHGFCKTFDNFPSEGPLSIQSRILHFICSVQPQSDNIKETISIQSEELEFELKAKRLIALKVRKPSAFDNNFNSDNIESTTDSGEKCDTEIFYEHIRIQFTTGVVPYTSFSFASSVRLHKRITLMIKEPLA